MTPERLRALLLEVAEGRTTIEDAESRLHWAPIEDLGMAQVDHHRALRLGFPEVIFGQGKTTDQVLRIAARLAEKGDGFLATRLAPATAEELTRAIPGADWNRCTRAAFASGAVIFS